jgi:hypothetical protein
MDSQQNVQVGVCLEHPPISPLSHWERARVRAKASDQTQINVTPHTLAYTRRALLAAPMPENPNGSSRI